MAVTAIEKAYSLIGTKLYSLRTFTVVTLLVSLSLVACRAESRTARDTRVADADPADAGLEDAGLIWEAWDFVASSYVGGIELDSVETTGSIIAGLLAAAEEPAYPFLTELDGVKTRVPSHVPKELTDAWKAWSLIRQKWPEIETDALTDAGVDGLLRSLGDDTARHLTAEAYERAQEGLRGTYQGIGAFIGVQAGNMVVSPMRDSPAQKAGVEEGDVLLAVNGVSVVGKTFQEAVEPVRGLAGTKVVLLIGREGEEEPLEITVIRGDIDMVSVDRLLLPGAIGNIYIANFQDNTPDELLNVVEELQQVDMLALILDLRSNSGGSIEAAQKIASQFLSDGLFMYEIDKDGSRRDWLIEAGGVATSGLPMVVLVNEFTGAAAEALAGALQDAERAEIMGARTAGRGSAHEFKLLSDGSAIYLPVSYWYTPSSRRIQGSGIEPDISVELTEEDRVQGVDSQLGEAYRHLNEQLPHFR